MTAFTRLPRYLCRVAVLLAVATLPVSNPAAASPRQSLLADFAASAKAEDATFDGFSAARGRALFLASPASGKPETPSCTACHTKNPRGVGETRAGKRIEPMALSQSPDRYTDPKKVGKWFRRNCKSVLGRICSAREKGDYLTFMISQ